MPRRNWKLRVQDILEAIEGAREYVAGIFPIALTFSPCPTTNSAVARASTDLE